MFVFVDTETTGLPQGGVEPRIVSIAWMIAGAVDQPVVFRHVILRPDGFVIPDVVVRIHGISTARAMREGVALPIVLDVFAADIAAAAAQGVVAHNLAFDRPIIEAEFSRLGRTAPFATLNAHCTMIQSRQRWPGERAGLARAFERMFGRGFDGAHDAANDVWACAQLFFGLHGACDRARPCPTWSGLPA